MPETDNKRVMIIAGEASGDLHAAKLVREVHQKSKNIQFYGIGGKNMVEAGVETLVDSADLAVVGLFEVLAHWNTISAALKKMQHLLRTDPPDLLVLTDYPDFNLRLAKTAKECGVKVLFYISPQVWAWRQKRVFKIREIVDMMAVVFPFEESFYKKFNVPVRFVGHPLIDEVHASADQIDLRNEFLLDNDKPVIGLFPGSRHSEIKRLLPIIVESAKRIMSVKPDSQFVIPVASTLKEEDILPYFEGTEFDMRIIHHRSHDVMQVCDAIITVSGTVTLEIALMQKPMVVINKISAFSYFFVSRMLKISHIALCNIVANKRIVPELIQNNAQPDKIANTLCELINNQEVRATIISELGEIKEKLSDDKLKTDLSTLLIDMLEVQNSAVP
ncbi:MAG: lipid-A-disaccharide synthase [Gammaproteobacteria bacterium]|nr:lipid-A-disaccharide synthase [Gammaproteobacteria bacterium]MCW8988879.1 lipid-A-disaccharide synthase [Gammaproteobacteria bacterium]MCW9032394.1 lipid-A-disaccharide synthase [Gammaproteobacteria bacterium]